MANQIWIFRIHISKMTSKSQYEKNLDAFAPYYYDDESHIDSLTPLIESLSSTSNTDTDVFTSVLILVPGILKRSVITTDKV